MDLKSFGEQLHAMRKRAGLSQERLANAVDQAARNGPADDYRVIDSTLVSRWERAQSSDGRQWKPTRPYVLHLARLFAAQLDAQAAQAWAGQAGYRLAQEDLATLFPAATRGDGSQAIKPKPPRQLPSPLTSFIGREREVIALIESLADPSARFVTVVGEGGTGKTRLALAAAHAATDEALPTDGVCFVPLAGVEPISSSTGPNPVASAIAKSVSLTFSAGDDPSQQLIRFLQPKSQLLILDNCEHLMDESAFITDLLTQAPGVRAWVTSRVPLNYQAERVLRLSGLPIPAESAIAGASGEAIATVPSVQLFIERARQRNQSAAEFDARTLSDVASLCRMVDGSPLALELAANWVGHISMADMVATLRRHDLSLLATDQRDMPVRHRSMLAVFDASWQLLTADSQRTLTQLSVFRGTFTREAASVVAGATLHDMTLLVNRSLLSTIPHASGATVYAMHALLRQFANAKLTRSEDGLPAQQQAEQRHAEYYLRQVAECRDAFYGDKSRIALSDIDATVDNVRAAWQWSVGANAVSLLAEPWLALRNFYHVRGLYHEAEAVFADAATLARRHAWPGQLADDLQTAHAFFLNQLHRYEQAIHVAQDVLSRAKGMPSLAALRAQLEWGIALSLQSKHDEAITQLTEVAARARASGAPLVEARASHAMYRNFLAKGNLAGADAVLDQAARLYQGAGYVLAEGFVRDAMGHVASRQGMLAKARNHYQAAFDIYDTLDDHVRATWSQQYLGKVESAMGAFGRAYTLHMAAYARRNVSQDQRAVVGMLHDLARLLGQMGDYTPALQYAHEAVSLYRHLGYETGVIEALCNLGWVQAQSGDSQSSLASFHEAVTHIEASDARTFNGAALLGIGEALIDLGRLDEAWATLQLALTVQREMRQTQAASATLSALARAALAQGRVNDALALVEEILTVVNAHGYEHTGELPPIYWACYQVLRAAADERAMRVLQAAHQLVQAQAASLADEALRQSFLSRVKVNRVIAEASSLSKSAIV